MGKDKLRSQSGMSQLEMLCAAGIILLTAVILAIACFIPAEQGRASVDSADLDNAKELAVWDYVSERHAQGRWDPIAKTYTYYYAPQAGEIGVKLSAGPVLRGRSLPNRNKTVVVVLNADGTVNFAGWTAVPEG